MLRRIGIVGLLAGTLALGAGAGAGGDERAARELSASCAYDAPTKTVSLQLVSDTAVLPDSIVALIRRSGEEIKLSTELGPLECTGPTPTVTNTDRIEVAKSGRLGVTLKLSLGGGPLAPGATPEPTGESEIEVAVAFPRLRLEIRPTDGEDHYVFGDAPGGPALNLNAAEDSGDADLTFPTGARPRISVGSVSFDRERANRGRDLVSAAGGAGTGEEFSLGFYAVGGGGADTLVGGSGNDTLLAGDGRDRVAGGAGEDQIEAEGGDRDRIDCGPDRDRVGADRRDRVRGCEKRFD